MNQFSIQHIEAGEILDSRGDPTVAVSVTLASGARGYAAVPSGASTGKHEAHELRDGNPQRYGGRGVLKACSNVHVKILPVIRGMNAEDQEAIDRAMIRLDGTEHKKAIGANAILAVSLAVARAAAVGRGMELFESIRETFGFKPSANFPTPIMNLVNGGKHASTNLALQEFQIIPELDGNPKKQIEAGSEIFHALGELMARQGLDTDVGNEGGYAPNVKSIESVLDLMVAAISAAGYEPGKDVSLGLDAAAASFFDEERGEYIIAPPRESLSAVELLEKYEAWIKSYPIASFEDPFGEEEWDDWAAMTKKHGRDIMIIGDDLIVTNVKRLKMSIDAKAANAVLIKLNQIGTLMETIDAIKLARKHNYKIIISHRSGETDDTFITDLAVAVSADYLKAGAPSRGERVAKYNRLMEIADMIKISN